MVLTSFIGAFIEIIMIIIFVIHKLIHWMKEGNGWKKNL